MNKSFYDKMPKSIPVRDSISLRLLVPDDAERIFAIFQADPDIQKMVTWTFGLHTIDDIRTRLIRFEQQYEVRYAIQEKGIVIGYIGTWKDDGYFGVTHEDEYGYGCFCDPSKRGQGITTDAAKAMLQTIQSVVPVRTFSAYIEDINTSSQAVAKKLGFVRTDETYLEPVLGSTERRYVRTV